MNDESSPPSPVGKGAGGLGPLAHYAEGIEAGRLQHGSGQIEFARTREIVSRYLPPPPAVIFDIGGGPGVYALWLARLGYAVHLIDPVPLHVEQARQASARQPDAPIAALHAR